MEKLHIRAIHYVVGQDSCAIVTRCQLARGWEQFHHQTTSSHPANITVISSQKLVSPRSSPSQSEHNIQDDRFEVYRATSSIILNVYYNIILRSMKVSIGVRIGIIVICDDQTKEVPRLEQSSSTHFFLRNFSPQPFDGVSPTNIQFLHREKNY